MGKLGGSKEHFMREKVGSINSGETNKVERLKKEIQMFTGQTQVSTSKYHFLTNFVLRLVKSNVWGQLYK